MYSWRFGSGALSLRSRSAVRLRSKRAWLASEAARAAIPALLARFPQIRQGAEPHRWRPTAVLRGLKCLPVRTA